jgi:hypothetical protein
LSVAVTAAGLQGVALSRIRPSRLRTRILGPTGGGFGIAPATPCDGWQSRCFSCSDGKIISGQHLGSRRKSWAADGLGREITAGRLAVPSLFFAVFRAEVAKTAPPPKPAAALANSMSDNLCIVQQYHRRRILSI